MIWTRRIRFDTRWLSGEEGFVGIKVNRLGYLASIVKYLSTQSELENLGWLRLWPKNRSQSYL